MGNLHNGPAGTAKHLLRMDQTIFGQIFFESLSGIALKESAEIFLRKVAPLGDPLEINVRGYELSLRKADAEMILIG